CNSAPASAEVVELEFFHADYVSPFAGTGTESIKSLRDQSAVTVLPRGHAVSGVVRDASGKPLVGATVSAGFVSLMPETPRMATNERGEFRFEHLRLGSIPIVVTAKGFAPQLQTVV